MIGKVFFRLAILKAIDNCWIEEVDNLQQLRTVVSARQYAQRNPIYEYHQEAMTSFKKNEVENNATNHQKFIIEFHFNWRKR